jgi:hypothetical protein
MHQAPWTFVTAPSSPWTHSCSTSFAWRVGEPERMAHRYRRRPDRFVAQLRNTISRKVRE